MKQNRRFFTPNINSWKYIQAPVKLTKKRSKIMRMSDEEKDAIIDNSTQLVDFAVSFTKTVVRISFVLFVAVNLFILVMTTIHYFSSGELLYLDTLITESYGMLRDVIAAYIIKAATENSLRIGFSVLSDYLDKKYDIKVKPDNNGYDYYNYDPYDSNDIDIPEDEEDPMDDSREEEPEDMEGGIEFLK